MGDLVFGTAVRRERTARGWSQEYLARRLRVSRMTVMSWEHGLTHPRFDEFGRICRLFGWSRVREAGL